jgi:uncharacterized membrane protein
MRARFPWFLALAYAVIFALLGTLKYAVHRNLVDFGIFAQTAGSAFGCFCNAIEGSHWAFHFSPILYVPGALLVLMRSPLVLIALQSIVCALVIPPIYAMIATRAPSSVAALGAVVTALYPSLAGLAFGDFHENVFAPAAIVWCAWALDAGYLAGALLFAVIAICVKEDQAIFVGIAGAAIAWRSRGTRRAGYALAAALLGFGATAAFFFAIQPGHVAAPHWSPERFYNWTAADLRALPFGIVQRAGFLLLIFVPLAFVPMRARAFAFAVPPLAEVLLSRMSTTFTLGTHYAGAWLGYVLVAFAFGLREATQPLARRLSWLALGLCIVELAVADPLHPGLNLRPVQARDRALNRAIADLPPDASVATQEEAYTHLALRDANAGLLPERSGVVVDTCFILIDEAYPDSPRLVEYGAALRALVQNGTYVLVKRSGGVELYRRAIACR